MAVILPVECIRDQVSASFASTSANLYTSIPRSCFGGGKNRPRFYFLMALSYASGSRKLTRSVSISAPPATTSENMERGH